MRNGQFLPGFHRSLMFAHPFSFPFVFPRKENRGRTTCFVASALVPIQYLGKNVTCGSSSNTPAQWYYARPRMWICDTPNFAFSPSLRRKKERKKKELSLKVKKSFGWPFRAGSAELHVTGGSSFRRTAPHHTRVLSPVLR